MSNIRIQVFLNLSPHHARYTRDNDLSIITLILQTRGGFKLTFEIRYRIRSFGHERPGRAFFSPLRSCFLPSQKNTMVRLIIVDKKKKTRKSSEY